MSYSPQIANSGSVREAHDYRAHFSDGRLGSDRAQATPEKGDALANLVARSLVHELEVFSRESTPTAPVSGSTNNC